MAGSLLPQPKQTFTDDTGKPLSGGQIYTYAAGSLTPKATYQDQALTIANTNPVIANARGEVTMYGDGAYRVILKDKQGSTVWDRDNVVSPSSAIAAAAGTLNSALAAASGASLVGFQPATGLAARTVQDALRDFLSPKSFGVKADGVTDDWAAWTAFFAEYLARTTAITGAAGFGATTAYSAPAIVPIAGKSLLSQPLSLPSYVNADFGNLLFDRHPSWSQSAGTYLITSSSLYQAKLGGVSLRGVSYGLEIKNPNLDQGHIHVSGVKFSGGDYAVRVDCQSSTVILSDFKADGVPHFLEVVTCDRMTLRDGWISQGQLTAAKDATITNRALLIIDNVLGVPTQHNVGEVAWINNYAFADVRGMRFGGEAGSCAAINNFAAADVSFPGFATGVSLRDSETYSVDTQASTQTSCIVRLFALPNVLRIEGNRGLIDTQKYVTWGSTADQAGELAKYAANSAVYSLFYGKNQGRSGSNIAALLPANLYSLFFPAKVVLTATAAGSGITISDPGMLARGGQVWDLVIRGNPAGGGSSAYLSVWRGSVACVEGFNGTAIVRRLSAAAVLQGNGGPTFGSGFTVSAVFVDGGAEVAEVPDANTTAKLRIKVAGWQAGYEGTSFAGAISEVLFN